MSEWRHLGEHPAPRRKPRGLTGRTRILVAVAGVFAVLGGIDQMTGGALSRLGDGGAQMQQDASYQPGTGVWQPAPGQAIPPPVDLPIENLRQETEVWCWAAVSQQIIAASRGQQSTPAQCALVAMANGVEPGVCCNGYNQQCVRTGSLEQIQALIAQFGGRYSGFAEPTDPMTLYRTLAGGHAVILALQTGPQMNHVVVLRGMSFVQTQGGVEPVLHINDPMQVYTQPVPYRQLVQAWRKAIVIN
ncbi:MAG: hypothetical protein IV086_18010 [Hyphomonadaceae bacterium]|nr:hypothetical protein [Hyphomonadaceae bacterium]